MVLSKEISFCQSITESEAKSPYAYTRGTSLRMLPTFKFNQKGNITASSLQTLNRQLSTPARNTIITLQRNTSDFNSQLADELKTPRMLGAKRLLREANIMGVKLMMKAPS